MATATFTATATTNFMSTSTWTRWRQGTAANRKTSSYSYNSHVYKTLMAFNKTSIATTLTNMRATSISMSVVIAPSISGYVSGSIVPWVTAWTSMPSAATVSSSFSGLTTNNTNTNWTRRLSTFAYSAVANATYSGTIASGAAAETLAADLIAGRLLGMLPTTWAPGSSVGNNAADNYISGSTTTSIHPSITITYEPAYSINVNVGGTWKGGEPYVNVGGTWKKGIAYVNVGGAWKQGI